MLALKRMRRRATLFAALFGVAAIVSGLGMGLIGYLGAAETLGTRVELASRSGSDVGLQVALPLAADATTQDEQVREVIASQFRNGDRAIPITVDRTVGVPLSVGLVIVAEDGSLSPRTRVSVQSVPEFESRASLVDGRWPTTASEATIQADAAALIGIVPGTVVRLGDVDLTVVGTWRINDELDPRSFGDPLVTAGTDGEIFGPVIVDEAAWGSLVAKPEARWTILPVVDRIEASDLESIVTTWRDLPGVIRQDLQEKAAIGQEGRLVRTAIELQSRLDALSAVKPVALLIIAAIGIVALVELARLLAGLRAEEIQLLWSRGATPANLSRSTGFEALTVSVLGALAGAGAACGILFAIGGQLAVAQVGPVGWAVPVAVVVTSVAVFAVTSFLASRAVATMEARTDGRATRIGGGGAVVLVVIAGAVSMWQLLLYGSPVTPAADGGTQVDPLAVSAPSLSLLALVLLGLASIPLLARRIDRRAAAATGYVGPFVSRTLSRRLRIAATPLVLLALASGQFMIASAYQQTWQQSYTATTDLRSGSELKVTSRGNRITQELLQQVARQEGVTSVAPVFMDIAGVGPTSASLVAVTPTALADLATAVPGILDPTSVAAAIESPARGAVIPDGTRTLTLKVTTKLFGSPAIVSALLENSLGATLSLPLTSATGGYSVEAPAGNGWRVVGFDVLPPDDLLPGTDEEGLPSFEITGLAGDGVDLPLGAKWVPVQVRSAPEQQGIPTDTIGFAVDSFAGHTRLLPTLGDNTDDIAVPIAISRDLAEANGIAVGDSIRVSVDPRWEPLSCAVATIVPAVPGATSGSAVLLDFALIRAIQLRTYEIPAGARQLWVGVDGDTVPVAAALRESLPAQLGVDATATDPSRGILASASIALLVGAAGAALLAIVAVAAVVGAQLRSRRSEVMVLKALGVGSREIATMRRWELGVIMAAGAVIGAIAGTVVALLSVPSLARAAIPGRYQSLPTLLSVDPLSLATGFAVILLLLGAVLLAYGRSVTRQSRRLSVRESIG